MLHKTILDCGTTPVRAHPTAAALGGILGDYVISQAQKVECLERTRDLLMSRVKEATAREQTAGDRLAKLEEELVEAKDRSCEAR